MENSIDRQLIARIRRSDEQAFYTFCHRHWKSLYLLMLRETRNPEEAFERVKSLLEGLWDKRKRLPTLSTTVVEYILDPVIHPNGEAEYTFAV